MQQEVPRAVASGGTHQPRPAATLRSPRWVMGKGVATAGAVSWQHCVCTCHSHHWGPCRRWPACSALRGAGGPSQVTLVSFKPPLSPSLSLGPLPKGRATWMAFLLYHHRLQPVTTWCTLLPRAGWPGDELTGVVPSGNNDCVWSLSLLSL